MAIMNRKCIHLQETRLEDDRLVISPSDWIHIDRKWMEVLKGTSAFTNLPRTTSNCSG